MAVVRIHTSAGWLDLGSDGGGEYYEQDEEPEDASVGAIWYDTDAEPVVGGVGNIILAPTVEFKETFVNLSAYTVDSGSPTISSDRLTCAVGGSIVLRRTGVTYEDHTQYIKIVPGDARCLTTIMAKWLNTTNYLQLRSSYDGVTSTFYLQKVDGGTGTTFVTLSPPASYFVAGRTYWMRFTITDATVDAGLYSVNPFQGGKADYEITYLLVGSDATKYGPAVSGQIGFRNSSPTGSAGPAFWDDHIVLTGGG